MKPDWSKAPVWANFLAMDKNGGWYWYRDKPFLSDHHWEWRGSTGFVAAEIRSDWIDSLEERP